MPVTKKTKLHPAQTPAGFLVTGLLMWFVGYLLMTVAVQSGSLLQWLGVFLALSWGLIRVGEGLYKLLKK